MAYKYRLRDMPKIAKELTALQVGRIKADGSHAVGGVPGLHLRIKGISRAWVLRFSVAGKRHMMGLGSVQTVSLAQARDLARAAHQQIKAGQEPISERRAQRRSDQRARANALTFRAACERCIAAREREWRNDKHRAQWVNTLATYADPVLGALDVSEIGTDDILRVLEPIWATKTETATRVRGRIEQVLNWATVRGARKGENPARWRGHLDQLLPQPGKIAKVRHHPAAPVDETPAIVAQVAHASGQAAQALMLQILTAGRSGEVLGARWSEIDLDAALWTVPAERMKAGREHRIPLSRQAVALLRAQPVVAGCDLVFPSSTRPGAPLSDMTLTAVLRRLQAPCVPHGFRSTFRDWAAETTSTPGEVVEMALAHAIRDKTEAAYRRGDLLAKRAALMQAWADYCWPMPVKKAPPLRSARSRRAT